jgi:hypothetical protein
MALCFCFACLRLMYPMLPVSLDCPLFIAFSVFSGVYSRLICIMAHFYAAIDPYIGVICVSRIIIIIIVHFILFSWPWHSVIVWDEMIICMILLLFIFLYYKHSSYLDETFESGLGLWCLTPLSTISNWIR